MTLCARSTPLLLILLDIIMITLCAPGLLALLKAPGEDGLVTGPECPPQPRQVIIIMIQEN